MKKEFSILSISYSDKNYMMSKRFNLWTAKHIGGADNTRAYGPEDLSEEFRQQASGILEMSRGGGYWAWKPYILLDAMKYVDENDYIIYTDAGLFYIDRIIKMVGLMRENGDSIFLSSGFAPCRDWTKRDVFILMDCDNEEAYNFTMVSGGYVIIKKDDFGRKFLQEWLNYSVDKRIITDIPNTCGKRNHPNFRQHRHDQSILSLLCYKYGIKPYKAVSCVDEPKTHRKILDGFQDAYRYSFYVRLRYIEKEHRNEGYIRSRNAYKRIFINTHIKDCDRMTFAKKLIKVCIETAKTDRWGAKWDDHYVRRAGRYHDSNE